MNLVWYLHDLENTKFYNKIFLENEETLISYQTEIDNEDNSSGCDG